MQYPLELILTRQWASHLDYAVWVMSDEGTLVYYNVPAEKLLGLSYEITGEIAAKDLQNIFQTTDAENLPIPGQELPVNIALRACRPTHKQFKVRSLEGTWRWIESTAFPLLGPGRRLLGAVSIFWEINIP